MAKASNPLGWLTYLTIIVILVTALLMALAGEVYGASPQSRCRLYGEVRDTHNRPIANSIVHISDHTFSPVAQVTTDSSGSYEVSVTGNSQYNLYVAAYSQSDRYSFAYIPEQKNIATHKTDQVKVDFSLKSGGTVAINAFDEEGRLLRNKDFRLVTNQKVFATDLNSLPIYYYFDAIHDENSNWQWEQAIPAFVIPPEATYKFYFQWEVPGFGKTLLCADNNGKGYQLSAQGERLTINLNYEVARSHFAGLQRSVRQLAEAGYNIPEEIIASMEQSETHLKEADKHLSQSPTDMKKVVDELNKSLQLSLSANERLHLAKAKVDIEKYRKGTAAIKIVDDEGKPLPDVKIECKQISHDFLFGATPMGRNGSYDPWYAKLIKDSGINRSNITIRWGRIEPKRGAFDWSNIDLYQDIDAQLEAGFKLTGSLSMWLYRNRQVGDDFCPDYLSNLTFDELKKNVYRHMHTLANRYRGKIDTWEINEMNLSWANYLDLTGEQKFELIKTFTEAIKTANPKAKVLMNSMALPFEFASTFSDLDTVPYPVMLDFLKDRGWLPDVIGLEFYYSGVTGSYVQPVLELTAVSKLLDEYSKYGRPIYVNEFSVPSRYIAGSGWWHRPWDEPTQAEYLEGFYTIAFSKPFVQSINWAWGSTDQDAFIPGGGLLDSHLNPKPAYYTLKRLIESWSTTQKGTTDSSGMFSFRGFAGEYEIIIEAPSGQKVLGRIHIYEQTEQQFTLQY